MPTTVNGIGTHYYGKKNRSMRTAACRSCKRVANLESYDTRLWFVIIFIPIIPLGRKRVIDSCPICSRHFVASADAYEQARQLQVSAAQDQFRREPSPPAALQVHAALLGFHEREQAAKFRQTVHERFPADAELMAGLAAQLENAGSYQEAGELYEAAHRLQPELPEARVAVAMRKMAGGELDDARRLLDFLEIPAPASITRSARSTRSPSTTRTRGGTRRPSSSPPTSSASSPRPVSSTSSGRSSPGRRRPSAGSSPSSPRASIPCGACSAAKGMSTPTG